VGKTPAQCHRDDQKYCDHTGMLEPSSSGRMLPHWGDDREITFFTRMTAECLSEIAHSDPGSKRTGYRLRPPDKAV
jgi:hypothetical protein